MAENKSIPIPRDLAGRQIRMTMDAPYQLYIDADLVAEYQDEAEAEARYQTLLGRPPATPPADLTSRFLPSNQARFELLRCGGDGLSARLWRSTSTVPAINIRKQQLHVTKGDELIASFFGDLDGARAVFARASQTTQPAQVQQ